LIKPVQAFAEVQAFTGVPTYFRTGINRSEEVIVFDFACGRASLASKVICDM